MKITAYRAKGARLFGWSHYSNENGWALVVNVFGVSLGFGPEKFADWEMELLSPLR